MTSNHVITNRGNFASRRTAFEDSPWSAASSLLKSHPDPIYFGSGSPALEAQPLERLQWAAQRAWAEADGALGYGELAGFTPLRELVVERMKSRGIASRPDNVIITNGSQQGIDLISKLMLDPGDQIIVEGPTYIGAMQTFDAYEASYLVCPVDDQGICVESLNRILARPDANPKFLYSIPAFQNPTGYSLSASRRQQLLETAEHHRMLIVEDDPYGDLYYDDPPESALRADNNSVVYLGTFSKTIAPGLRVGWMLVPDNMVEYLLMAREGADVHGNRIAARTVYHAASGWLDEHVVDLRDIYRARRDAIVGALEEKMPREVTFAHPEGGFFLWSVLPEGLQSMEFLKFSAHRGVAFLPGEWFYPEGAKKHNGFRLNFSSLPVDQIELGVDRLADAAEQFVNQSQTVTVNS